MDYPTKSTPLNAPIINILERRWSPKAFSDTELPLQYLESLFEAARWAPSCFNEQPWRYVYAQKSDPKRPAMESLLDESNGWAKQAGLLIVSFTSPTFAKNGKENRHAMHDLGCASGYLVLEATARGLISHQMAGFSVDKANETLNVLKEFIPGSMIAIGYPGDPQALPEKLRVREAAPRTRNKSETFSFKGLWM
ncbi:MAG: nitroreductase family protein [Candidatus Peribacteraceae bacterium]|nr:nitroreductase family protein [Candidatus Peribacteraceae bacterium]